MSSMVCGMSRRGRLLSGRSLGVQPGAGGSILQKVWLLTSSPTAAACMCQHAQCDNHEQTKGGRYRKIMVKQFCGACCAGGNMLESVPESNFACAGDMQQHVDMLHR